MKHRYARDRYRITTSIRVFYSPGSGQDKERALREEMAATRTNALKAKEDARGEKSSSNDGSNHVSNSKKVENIFTSRASSGVLTKDLLDIQRREAELGMAVRAVDDNIFHWQVGCRSCAGAGGGGRCG